MESSVGNVRQSFEVVRLDGRHVQPVRPPNNAGTLVLAGTVPPAPGDPSLGSDQLHRARATGAIGGLLESVRRKVLSIGENQPPYLPVTRERAVDLSEEAAQVKSIEVRRALQQVGMKSLALDHAELRRVVDVTPT